MLHFTLDLIQSLWQVKELREKREVMQRKRDNTIARGEAAVQKIMREVRLPP